MIGSRSEYHGETGDGLEFRWLELRRFSGWLG